MTLTQQWRYLNLTRKSFYILFPAKGIVSFRQIIYSRLCVRLKETYSLAENFETPVNELNNFDVNYVKMSKKHRGPHKTPSRATCGPPAACLRPLLLGPRPKKG